MLFSFLLRIRLQPRSTLFPYTTLFRSFKAYDGTLTLRPFTWMCPWHTIWRAAARVFARPRWNTTLSRREHSRCRAPRSEEHTSELQSRVDFVCRLLLEKKKT